MYPVIVSSSRDLLIGPCWDCAFRYALYSPWNSYLVLVQRIRFTVCAMAEVTKFLEEYKLGKYAASFQEEG